MLRRRGAGDVWIRPGQEWTVIEKYQSKTRQGPEGESYYVNPVLWSSGRVHMLFFCNAPLLSKPLSPVTGWLVSPDRQWQWGEGRDYQVEHVAITGLMLSVLWDKQPLAGQTIPISIRERWRPCALTCLHLFLYCFIFAWLPSLYFTRVLSCVFSRLADLLLSNFTEWLWCWDKNEPMSKNKRRKKKGQGQTIDSNYVTVKQEEVVSTKLAKNKKSWMLNHFLFFCIFT